MLTAALETDAVALNVFDLAPGEATGYDYHRHLDRAEGCYVQDGTLDFETADGPVSVSSGEVVRFAPGEFELGRNAGDGRARVLAVGAPRDFEAIECERDCPRCGERTIQTIDATDGGEGFESRCPACDATVDEFP